MVLKEWAKEDAQGPIPKVGFDSVVYFRFERRQKNQAPRRQGLERGRRCRNRGHGRNSDGLREARLEVRVQECDWSAGNDKTLHFVPLHKVHRAGNKFIRSSGEFITRCMSQAAPLDGQRDVGGKKFAETSEVGLRRGLRR